MVLLRGAVQNPGGEGLKDMSAKTVFFWTALFTCCYEAEDQSPALRNLIVSFHFSIDVLYNVHCRKFEVPHIGTKENCCY